MFTVPIIERTQMKIKLSSIIHNDIINEPHNFISKVIFTNNTTNDCIVDHVDQKWIILYVIPNFEYVDTSIYKIAHNWYNTGDNPTNSWGVEEALALHIQFDSNNYSPFRF